METFFRLVEIFLGGVVGFLIQKLRNRPQVVNHHCRIADIDVYTYFDSANKPSKPACALLSPEGNCQLLGKESNLDPGIKEGLAFHKEKCYLAQWNK